MDVVIVGMSTAAAAAPGPDTTALAWLIGIPASTAVVSSTAAIDLLSMKSTSASNNGVARKPPPAIENFVS
jgi:hypothetical protein